MPISPAELARIRTRHADIEQDTLPLEIDDTPPQSDRGSEVRTKTIKSVKWAKCPHHTPSGKAQLTGLIRLNTNTLVFRDHTKTVGKHTITCPGSGEPFTDTASEGAQ